MRSGVLTSVHAFASDPTRGVFILTYLVVVVGGSLLLFAIRAPPWCRAAISPAVAGNPAADQQPAAGRDGGHGSDRHLYPLLLDALDAGKISVGPPYFGTLFALLLVPIAVLLPLGFYASWQEDSLNAAGRTRVPAILRRAGRLRHGLPAAHSRRLGHRRSRRCILDHEQLHALLPPTHAPAGPQPARGETGMILAHFGVGLFLVGASLTNAVSSEKHLRMVAGDSFELAGYNFVFEGTRGVRGPNYVADEGEFIVYKAGKRVTSLYPQKRRYSNGQVMTEAALDPGLTRDLYCRLGEPLDDRARLGDQAVPQAFHPLYLDRRPADDGRRLPGRDDRRYRRSAPVDRIQGLTQTWRRRRHDRQTVPVIIFLALGILLAVGLKIADHKTEIPSPLIGKQMPEFTCRCWGSRKYMVAHDELIGTPFLLNVWASWCVTCRVEHPVIEELAQSGLIRVVGLNYRDEEADAQAWLARFGNPYELNIADITGRTAIDFGVYAAPESFLVDPEGTIVFKQIGAVTPEIIREEIVPGCRNGVRAP